MSEFSFDASMDKKIGKSAERNPFIMNSFIINLSDIYLPFFDWEIDDFLQELKKINSTRKIVPVQVSFDLKSERTIVHKYTLDGQDCPFLSNNKCNIYEKRPIACKQFPCMYDLSGLISGQEIKLYENTGCKFERENELKPDLNNRDEGKLSRSDIVIFLKKRYGDSLFYNLEGAAYSRRSNIFLINLEKEGKIKLARKGYDLKYLLKRINNSDAIGFSKLYEEITGNPRKSIYDMDSIKSHFSKY
ncbi:MAG: YkgJ family cysteine cluster protein [Methanocellales archaeon]|nr:YkgJ family cysteine cluster protein [Methanocellales archaeon]MDD3291565.1 YkgJ family cysteine cluster protein [Methanocellales archaeon]MDD5235854.1 YkgJ family cysteine cluster protein [Methanocellales archaeon]MDD5485347.1 YkgJ family cysteine cluster protein [Methanocellales archaeon]